MAKYEPTRTPDVIVIEAGGTDVNPTCLSMVYDSDRVGIDVSCAEQISKDFLLSLKTKNPNTKIIWCYGTYYNNDYTVEGATGTAITREMKARRADTIETAEEPEDSEVIDDDE